MENSFCLTPFETAKLLHISKSQVYRMLHDGRIPHIRNGRRYLIIRSQLNEWLQAETITSSIERMSPIDE